jgi:hypothetical protein
MLFFCLMQLDIAIRVHVMVSSRSTIVLKYDLAQGMKIAPSTSATTPRVVEEALCEHGDHFVSTRGLARNLFGG